MPAHVSGDQDVVKFAVNDLPQLIAAWAQGGCSAEEDVAPTLRIIRNAPAQGPDTAQAALDAGAVPALASAVIQLLNLPAQTQANLDSDMHCHDAEPAGAPGAGRENPVLLWTLLAQALANFTACSPIAASQVWQHCFTSGCIHALLKHPAAKVHDPGTMVVYQCCRALAEVEQQLLSPLPSTLHLWCMLLDQSSEASDTSITTTGTMGTAAAAQPSSSSITGTKAVQGGEQAVAAHANVNVCSEWVLLLVGHLIVRRGALAELICMTCALDDSTAATAAAAVGHTGNTQQQDGQSDNIQGAETSACSTAITIDSDKQQDDIVNSLSVAVERLCLADTQGIIQQQATDSGLKQRLACLRKLSHLQYNRRTSILLYMAAHELEVIKCDDDATPSSGRGMAWWSVAAVVEVLGCVAKQCRLIQALGLATVDSSYQAAAHVLESSLECIKSFMMRKDQGRKLFPASVTDPISELCDKGDLLLRVLGMLVGLQPIQNPRKQSQPASPSTDQPSSSQAQPAGLECRAHLPPSYWQVMPVRPPYLGYRGDLLCLIANATLNRPLMAKKLAAMPGAVMLLLSQCQLDEMSPLAKEWSTWAIRNLCAGSPSACQQLAELQPVGAVDSPELQAMGMRLELDKMTGKMKVVRIDTADVPPQNAAPSNINT